MVSKKDFKKSTAKATKAAKADEAVASTVPTKSPKRPAAVKTASTQNSDGKSKRTAGSKVTDNAKPNAKKHDKDPHPKEKPASPKIGKALETGQDGKAEGTAKVLDSQIAYEGPLFRVFRDHLIEPGGSESRRDVIRHNGSVVILAVSEGKKKKDPWIVIERQYRHAAGQFLWELPAGKLDAGEDPIDGAKRELAEETGYKARDWSPLVEYYASPGFLGEAMKVFLAEGLVAGDAHPEEDENIDFRLVKLSEILKMVDKGKIIDGKTLTSVLLYARQLGVKRK